MEKTDLNKTWGNSCATCRYCGSVSAVDNVLQLVCRKRPPKTEIAVTPGGPNGIQVGTYTLWPEVKKTDWCGEYEGKMNS